MGCSASRDNSTKPSFTGFSRSRQQQQPPTSQTRYRPSPPVPARPGWNTESSNVSQQSRGHVGHSDGCRCIDCEPGLYDNRGNLKTGFNRPCFRAGCVCPVCRERESCRLRSEGHLLPDRQQCRSGDCICKLGCDDWNCRRCLTAISRRGFKGGAWGYA